MNDTANSIQWLTSFYSAAVVIQFTIIYFLTERSIKTKKIKSKLIYVPLILSYLAIFICLVLSALLMHSIYSESMKQVPNYISDNIQLVGKISFWVFIISTVFTIASISIAILKKALMIVILLSLFAIVNSNSTFASDETSKIKKTISLRGEIPPAFMDLSSTAEYKIVYNAKQNVGNVQVRFRSEDTGYVSVESYNTKANGWFPIASLPVDSMHQELAIGKRTDIFTQAVRTHNCDPTQVIFDLKSCTVGATVYFGSNGYSVGKIDENGYMSKDVKGCKGKDKYSLEKPDCESYSEIIDITDNPHKVTRSGIKLSCK